MKALLLLAITLLLMEIPLVLASPVIEVQALFSGKAIAQIDGQRRVLSVGEISPEGIKLIAADPNRATFEIDGKVQDYTLGSSISLNFAVPENIEEKVFANEGGMFLSVGSINGQSVRFLLDTGASSVAMNGSQAKRLGIRYESEGKPTTVSTASGFVKAYSVRLKTVSLGRIKRRNVDAVVIDGKHPGPILLGMSFLGRLKVEQAGNALILRAQ
jgi:aspartyl protease family protein